MILYISVIRRGFTFESDFEVEGMRGVNVLFQLNYSIKKDLLFLVGLETFFAHVVLHYLKRVMGFFESFSSFFFDSIELL